MLQDPRDKYPKPPFEEATLPFPGTEGQLKLKPDHGETSYKGSGRLAGRKALITGGDSGIGAAVALAFAREGADVVISHLPEEQEDADATVQKIKAEGRVGVSIPADLREQAQRLDLVQKAAQALAGIDILVNNASYQKGFQDISEVTEEEFDQAFKTNVYGNFFLTQAVAKIMPAGSVIINTTSIESYEPEPILAPYAATKAAITNMTKSLSKMLIQKGIRVNGVAPGPIWSPLNPMAMPKEQVEKFGQQSPMGRPGQPVELAPVYVFLASNDASYVTGAIYEVTGGMFVS